MRKRYTREAIHSGDIDQDLFDRSGIVCILECNVTSNGLPYYLCDNSVLHSNTTNLSIR